MERRVIDPKILNRQSHAGSGKVLLHLLQQGSPLVEVESCAKHAILEVYR